MAFSMKASSGGGGGSEIPPAGSHPAVLVGIIDLGTHLEAFQGVSKKQKKILLVWELTAEKMSGSTHNHVIARQFTYSFNSKAALRIVVEKWRGKAFQDGEDFDLDKMLGKPCMVTIVHTQSGDRTYAKVDGVTAAPKGLVVPPATRGLVCWELDSDEPVPEHDWLPYLFGQPVKAVIESCLENQGEVVGLNQCVVNKANEAPF